MKKLICLFIGLLLLIPSVIIIGPMETKDVRNLFLNTMHMSEMSAMCLMVFAFYLGAILTAIGIESISEKWKAY